MATPESLALEAEPADRDRAGMAATCHASIASVRGALHPLHRPPTGSGWNLDELDGLTPAGPAFPAAVLVGIVERPRGPCVVLTLRSGALRKHAGQVSFPGGRIDAGDVDAVSAALRETHEEIGVAAECIEPWGFLDPLATVTGFRVLPVVAGIRADYKPLPDSREVDAVFEVPLAYLLDPYNLIELRIPVAGRDRVIWEYRYPDHRIWGATASILMNLRNRIEACR